MRNVSLKSCRENQNTHFVFNNFFPKILRLWDNLEEYCRVGQATYDNMTHAHCMLDNWSFKHTLIICNIYCISTATVVSRTHLNVALHVLWPVLSYVTLYCLLLWFYCNKYLKSRRSKSGVWVCHCCEWRTRFLEVAPPSPEEASFFPNFRTQRDVSEISGCLSLSLLWVTDPFSGSCPPPPEEASFFPNFRTQRDVSEISGFSPAISAARHFPEDYYFLQEVAQFCITISDLSVSDVEARGQMNWGSSANWIFDGISNLLLTL